MNTPAQQLVAAGGDQYLVAGFLRSLRPNLALGGMI